MNENQSPVVAPSSVPSAASITARSSWKKKALIASGIILVTATLAAAGTAWYVKHNFYASAEAPVVLTSAEQTTLNDKLAALKQSAEAPVAVDPEVQRRTLTLSEREINAFLEQNGVSEQIKVALSDGGATATMLLPIGEDSEIGKGMTLRLGLSVSAKMDASKKFTLSIKDVSVGGISLPNAWLGYVKGLNLFENGNVTDDPAAKAFVDGIRDFSIKAGQLTLVLNE